MKRSRKTNLILIVSLALVFTIVFSYLGKRNSSFKSDFLTRVYDLSSYKLTTIYDFDDPKALEESFYQKDVGQMSIAEETEIRGFYFLTQSIIKNSDTSKWEMYLEDQEFLPGSPESILESKLENIDLSKVKKYKDLSTCLQLDLKEENCTVFKYDKDEDFSAKIFFEKDSKEIKLIVLMINQLDESFIAFSNLNDQNIRIDQKFEEMQPLMKEDIKEFLGQ